MHKPSLIILGGGESGIGTALLAKAAQFKVLVSDNGPIKEEFRDVLIQNNIEFETDGHSDKVLKADLIMKSPGIPEHIEIIKKLRESGVPIVSEIEFASNYTNATIVGITGSNGKTTTASLTHHLLKEQLR